MDLNPAGELGCLSVVSVVHYQVEVSVMGWSLVQRVLPVVVCLRQEIHEAPLQAATHL